MLAEKNEASDELKYDQRDGENQYGRERMIYAEIAATLATFHLLRPRAPSTKYGAANRRCH